MSFDIPHFQRSMKMAPPVIPTGRKDQDDEKNLTFLRRDKASYYNKNLLKLVPNESASQGQNETLASQLVGLITGPPSPYPREDGPSSPPLLPSSSPHGGYKALRPRPVPARGEGTTAAEINVDKRLQFFAQIPRRKEFFARPTAAIVN